MPQIGRSAKLYQERRQSAFQSTLRGPGPRVYLPDNAVNHLNLEPPYADAQILQQNCGKPTDTGRTRVWPFGDQYAE
jgi:hypothetical protein